MVFRFPAWKSLTNVLSSWTCVDLHRTTAGIYKSGEWKVRRDCGVSWSIVRLRITSTRRFAIWSKEESGFPLTEEIWHMPLQG